MMTGTKVVHLLSWAKTLLLRWPWSLPSQLRGMWYIIIVLALIILAGEALSVLVVQPSMGVSICEWIGGALIWVLTSGLVLNTVGEAARYLHVAPQNVDSRRKIRQAGVDLIQKLHQSGKYDRIVLVGHSLGSVIGYDILTHLWPQYNDLHKAVRGENPALLKLEEMARSVRGASQVPQDFAVRYQAAQSDFFAELAAKSNPWLVTDFVTFGAPLAHAALLLEKKDMKFEEMKQEREFPACPPVLERVDHEDRFSFAQTDMNFVPHHAAVFAATRWTNLYFPAHCTFWGDVIGGPVAPMFGPGVKDVVVRIGKHPGFFEHSKYWDCSDIEKGKPAPAHLCELRKAVRLCPLRHEHHSAPL
jgi:hypothetical protein